MRRGYALAAAALFTVETAIALFVKGGFIRHTLGDFLAVILVYCALMALTRLKPIKGALIAFVIALAIEIAQAAGIDRMLMIDRTALGRTLLGSTFDWMDVAAYAAGAVGALLVDSRRGQIS